jgi:two-component system OmpR family response regulator
MRVLVIEDDVETASQIRGQLKRAGHTVECITDGRDGLIRAAAHEFDAIVIDRMLPGLDGLTVVQKLRQQAIRTPVLFLTALGGLDDRVQGLNAGGDDYLTKPFEFPEFFARLNAITRRPPLAGWEPVLRVADLEMDRINRRVTRADKTIDLSPLEFRLLEYLMRNAGHVVARAMLLEKVWEFNFDPKTKIVETNVSRLRAKIERGRRPRLIYSKRGSGYVIRPPD